MSAHGVWSRLGFGDGDVGDRVRLAGVTVKWAMGAGTVWFLSVAVPKYLLYPC